MNPNNNFYRTMIHTTSPRRAARDCFYLILGFALAMLCGCLENAPPRDARTELTTRNSQLTTSDLPRPTPAKEVGSVQHTQAQLDRMLNSGGGVIGEKSFGGPVYLPAGELVWDRPLRWSQAQTIIGQSSATRIRYTGPAGTKCFTIVGNPSTNVGGNGYVDSPTLIGVQIECLNDGADAIGFDHSSAFAVKNLRVQDVVIRGGGIQLPDKGNGTGEHYWATFDNVRIYHPRDQALRLDGMTHTLRHFHVFGDRRQQMLGSQSPPMRRPLIDIRGSVTFEGYCWIEGWFPFTTVLQLSEWIGPGGYRHRGNFGGGLVWIEDHTNDDGPALVLNNCEWDTVAFGGTAKWPALLLRGSTLRLTRAINAGSIKHDGAKKPDGTDANAVLVDTKPQVMVVSQPER